MFFISLFHIYFKIVDEQIASIVGLSISLLFFCFKVSTQPKIWPKYPWRDYSNQLD